jgi:hypothetical protein
MADSAGPLRRRDFRLVLVPLAELRWPLAPVEEADRSQADDAMPAGAVG